MSLPPIPSIFESFNARALEPQQVAKTFVPPRQYADLLTRAHSLLVGPRGSGKTTLLKMLQQPALEAWHHPDASSYRSRIDFSGVFVPTDLSWSEQLKHVADKLNDEHRQLLAIAAFTTHVLRALVVTMQYRVSPPSDPTLVPLRRVQLDRDQEANFVKEMSNLWDLNVRVPSLYSLKYSLTARLSEIRTIASSASYVTNRDEYFSNLKYLHLHFISAALPAMEMFNDLVADPGGKWAFLFDELELAPQAIREELIKSLRSVDSHFLFKLSLSPYSEDVSQLHSAFSAMAGHDYEPVCLWYAYKEQGYDFCQALFHSMAKEYGLSSLDPLTVFGRSEFDTLPEEWSSAGTAYRPGSRLHKRFKSMAAKDSTFRRYLAEHAIDPDKLHMLPGDRRAAELRKIAPLLVVRDTFRASDDSELEKSQITATKTRKRMRRSRKNPTLYSGANSLFAIVEGNPRWIIAIIGRLLRQIATSKSLVAKPASQSREVAKASNRFRALLRTMPCSLIEIEEFPRGVLSIIDQIGDYFYDSVVIRPFNSDPYASFIIDSHIDERLIESLGRALNAGAIIYVPEDDSHLVMSSLKGKRFRVSYLLAPYYGIPIRLGPSVSLNAILQPRAPDNISQTSEDELNLFKKIEGDENE